MEQTHFTRDPFDPANVSLFELHFENSANFSHTSESFVNQNDLINPEIELPSAEQSELSIISRTNNYQRLAQASHRDYQMLSR